MKELTFGDWEGLTWPEVEARDPEGRRRPRRRQMEFHPAERRELRRRWRVRLTPWLEAIDHDLFVASHGGVARALMFVLGGVAPAVAADADIHQGRAIVFADGRFRWLG